MIHEAVRSHSSRATLGAMPLQVLGAKIGSGNASPTSCHQTRSLVAQLCRSALSVCLSNGVGSVEAMDDCHASECHSGPSIDTVAHGLLPTLQDQHAYMGEEDCAMIRRVSRARSLYGPVARGVLHHEGECKAIQRPQRLPLLAPFSRPLPRVIGGRVIMIDP